MTYLRGDKEPEVSDSDSCHHRQLWCRGGRWNAYTHLLGGSQLECRSLALTDAIPKHTLLEKSLLNAVIVMAAEHWTSVCSESIPEPQVTEQCQSPDCRDRASPPSCR